MFVCSVLPGSPSPACVCTLMFVWTTAPCHSVPVNSPSEIPPPCPISSRSSSGYRPPPERVLGRRVLTTLPYHRRRVLWLEYIKSLRLKVGKPAPQLGLPFGGSSGNSGVEEVSRQVWVVKSSLFPSPSPSLSPPPPASWSTTNRSPPHTCPPPRCSVQVHRGTQRPGMEAMSKINLSFLKSPYQVY